MILTIDVSNTNINCGVFAESGLITTFHLNSKQAYTSDEYGMMLVNLLQTNNIEKTAITGTVVASVVPGIIGNIASALTRYIGTSPLIMGPGTKTGIKITADNPREIGANRIATVVAGYELYGGPVLVIDFGTATTYDLVTADGCFGVGVTAPGLGISAEAMWEKTARLPEVEIKKPKSILAKETVSSIQAGLVYGQIGQTEYIINQIKKESGYTELKVVATGGLGRIIADETDTIQIFNSHLTLEGLKIIYHKNKL